MFMDTVAADVQELVAEAAGMDASDLKDSDVLATDLALDSLSLVRLAQQIEEFIEVEVPDSSVNAGMTVGQLIQEVKRLKGEK